MAVPGPLNGSLSCGVQLSERLKILCPKMEEGGKVGREAEGCHPGIPNSNDFDAQCEMFKRDPPQRLAAKVISTENKSELATIKILGDVVEQTTFSASSSSSSKIMGDIVERTISSSSIRPPNAISQPKVITTVTASSEGRDTLMNEIDLENRQRLGSMTTEEIIQEQEELKRSLPSKLLEKWSHSQ